MKNTFGWMHLRTSDSEKAQTFYRQLFEWTLDTKQKHEASYAEIDAGEGPCAGIEQAEKNEGSHWVSFVNVSDIHKYTDKAKSLGAQIIVPITDLGEGQGFYCVFMDPTGAVLGLYAPK